ncbi:hypothetical protein WA158_005756 [Blastocystis sp. Blastoise]
MDILSNPLSFMFRWIFLAVLLIITMMIRSLKPYSNNFFEGDLNLSYIPGNSISLMSIVIICYVLPYVVLCALFDSFYSKRKTHSMRLITLYVFVSSFVLSYFLSILLSTLFGSLKPSFFHLCRYDFTILENVISFGNYGAIGSITKCSAPIEDIYDAMRSFPSISVSIAIAGCSVTLYILIYYVKQQSKAYYQTLLRESFRYVLAIIAIVICVIIYRSNQASLTDILGGILLGTSACYICCKSGFKNVQASDSNYIIGNTDLLNEKSIYLQSYKSSF